MDIIMVTTAKTDAEAKALLKHFNMPFNSLTRRTRHMAKKAMVEREKKRQKLVAKYAAKRAALKEIANDEDKPMEERFKARLKLAKLPRNSSATRLHNRCQLTGRPKAYYRKLKMSRIKLRDLASSARSPAWSSRAGKEIRE
jgi:small subunit ribosomal protein S14